MGIPTPDRARLVQLECYLNAEPILAEAQIPTGQRAGLDGVRVQAFRINQSDGRWRRVFHPDICDTTTSGRALPLGRWIVRSSMPKVCTRVN